MRDELVNLPPYNGYTMFLVETPFNHQTENQVLRDYSRQEQVVNCTMAFMFRTIGPKQESVSISGGPFPKQKSMFLPWARYEPKRRNLEIHNPGNFAAQCPAFDDHACDVEPTPLPIECHHPQIVPPEVIPEDPLPDPQQSPLSSRR
ncbi:MAG: uncharacterized protein KVP18_001700 [Porospora cf. gigantea A]|uniref:uncharacterized protein n=1 Tax=Porospora cf. gigantea A TaxID=2853593 RepID=UPI00355A8750|nr:MAG: hypothetical protein KVP18_001700 [Porospora cf. gigantea A]